MMIKTNTYPFKGWDFEELCKAWNLPTTIGLIRTSPFPDHGYYEADYVIKQYLRAVLNKSWYKPWKNHKQLKSRVLRKVANDLSLYLLRLSQQEHSYYSPMWLGMSKIESDEELVKISSVIIGFMWD